MSAPDLLAVAHLDKARLYQGCPAQLSAPSLSTITTATTGGTLVAQQWNVAVTTVDASGNETTASPELAVTSTGSTSTVTVTWATVTGAAGFKVYLRSPVTGAPLGLVASVGSGTLTYTITSATTTVNPPTTNGTGETTLYTCPANTKTTLRQVVITNNNQQAATAALSVVPTGGTGGANNRVIPQSTEIRANSVRVFDFDQPLSTGDFLSATVSTSGVIVTISGLVQA